MDLKRPLSLSGSRAFKVGLELRDADGWALGVGGLSIHKDETPLL